MTALLGGLVLVSALCTIVLLACLIVNKRAMKMGNYKEVRREVEVPCNSCWGTGLEVGGKCSTCNGTRNVKRWVVELVPDDERVTMA